MGANNNYFSVADLKASDVSLASAFLLQVTNVENGLFYWMFGDFTGQSDDINIIKSDHHAIDQGAWVRQQSGTITYKNDSQNAETRTVADALSDFVSVFDFIPENLHFGIRNGTNSVDLAPYLADAIAF